MSIFTREYDIIVIGGGMAGAHAAKAASHCERVLLLTSSWDTVVWPAWGPIMRLGRVKGGQKLKPFIHRSLSDNVTALATINNEPISQIDTLGYQRQWKQALEQAQNITIYQDTAESLARTEGGWQVETRWAARFSAARVVIAVGTFLGSVIQIGNSRSSAGRPGEVGSAGLERSLRGLGVVFCTAAKNAPPTVSARSINWAKLQGLTSKAAHRPLYAAELADGRPIIAASIDSANRQIYPWQPDRATVAEEELRRVPGFAAMEAITPGYKVTYGCLSPGQLTAVGEHKHLSGLGFAGKIMGLTEYEESIVSGCAVVRTKRKVSRETNATKHI